MSDCLEPFENGTPKLDLPLARFVCGSLRALAFGPTLRLNTSFLQAFDQKLIVFG